MGRPKKTENNTIPDEVIISTLIQCRTIQETAKQLEISPRTIYNRMKNEDFRALYLQAKNDIFRNAVMNVLNMANGASEVIENIMMDANTAPAVRLKCAMYVLSMCADLDTKMDTLDHRARKTENMFADLMDLNY